MLDIYGFKRFNVEMGSAGKQNGGVQSGVQLGVRIPNDGETCAPTCRCGRVSRGARWLLQPLHHYRMIQTTP